MIETGDQLKGQSKIFQLESKRKYDLTEKSVEKVRVS